MGRKNSGNQVAAVANSFEPSALVATAESTSPVAQPSPAPTWQTAGMQDGKSINELLGGESETEESPQAIASPETPAALQGVAIEVPLAERSKGYESTRVEVYGFTEKQSAALDRMTAALRIGNARCQKRAARTADGIVVDTPADAIRWLLDRIDEGC